MIVSAATNRQPRKNARKPKPWQPSEIASMGPTADERLIAAVKCAMLESGYLFLRRLNVFVDDGMVVLRGKVATFYLKQVAQETVLATDGVSGIRNELDVICPGLSPRALEEHDEAAGSDRSLQIEA